MQSNPKSVIVKASFAGDCRKWKLNCPEITFDELTLSISRIFSPKLSVSDQLHIRYLDSEDDYVTICDTDGLKLALLEENPLRLYISRFSSDSSFSDWHKISDLLTDLSISLNELSSKAQGIVSTMKQSESGRTSTVPTSSRCASVQAASVDTYKHLSQDQSSQTSPLSNAINAVSLEDWKPDGPCMMMESTRSQNDSSTNQPPSQTHISAFEHSSPANDHPPLNTFPENNSFTSPQSQQNSQPPPPTSDMRESSSLKMYPTNEPEQQKPLNPSQQWQSPSSIDRPPPVSNNSYTPPSQPLMHPPGENFSTRPQWSPYQTARNSNSEQQQQHYQQQQQQPMQPPTSSASDRQPSSVRPPSNWNEQNSEQPTMKPFFNPGMSMMSQPPPTIDKSNNNFTMGPPPTSMPHQPFQHTMRPSGSHPDVNSSQASFMRHPNSRPLGPQEMYRQQQQTPPQYGNISGPPPSSAGLPPYTQMPPRGYVPRTSQYPPPRM